MPQGRTGVICVYRTRQLAHRAAAAAQRAGADPTTIRVGGVTLHVRSYDSDPMGAIEPPLKHAPKPTAFNKAMSNAIVPATWVGWLVGACVASPIALLHFGGLNAAVRVALVALIGGAAGSAFGFSLAARVGVSGTKNQGISVAVDDAPSDAIDAMRALHPISFDMIDS